MINQAGVTPAEAQAPQAPPTMPVEAARVIVTAVNDIVNAVGTLQSHQSVVIRPEITGRIAKISFKEGQTVKAGAVLFMLDDSLAKAEFDQAQAQLVLAEQNYRRASDLYARNVGTGRTRDETRSQLGVAQAQLQVAKAKLDKTRLRAPFTGIAGLRQVDDGAYVQPGQDLVNLEDVDPIKVDFRIPEAYLADLKSGQEIAISVDAYTGKQFAGKIYAIDPKLDTAGRSIAIRALIPNSEGALRPGLFARVALKIAGRKNAVTIPEEAVVPEGQAFYVFKIAQGKAVKTRVVLGLHKSGMIEVVSGLTGGDTVVTAGQQKLMNGFGVIVVNGRKPQQGSR